MSDAILLQLRNDISAAVTEITTLKSDKAALETANAALAAQNADLTTQLAAATAAQGTSDAELAPLATQLESVLDPAPVAPVEPPAAS